MRTRKTSGYGTWALGFLILVSVLSAAGCGDGNGGAGAPTVISAAGKVADSVEAYRDLLGGPNNGGTPGSQPSGRREINWDGVPDDFSAPNFLPPDFFNDAAAPRARGAFLETPGDGVQVSADADNPAGAEVRFGNINPTYAGIFETFSAERLFSPIGSNVVDLTFFVPGTDTPAVVTGFGAVYTDVDRDDSSFEPFDADDHSLGRFSVPVNDNGLSFLGIAFSTPIVAHVRIAYGNSPLGADESDEIDVAVMDDFIYGEPQAIE
jgi:hypothetical protein